MPDRYASAKEMSDDLRWFLESGGRQESLDSVKGIRARGLRPYTSDDSESFWTLLPGYRNARGVPESVAWWLRRLQDENDEPRRAVLVLYGPSGSGKSSLLHAGVLPFLDSRRSLVCALDASEFESTAMLVRELSETTKLESGSSLPEFVGRLRDRSSRPTLITIDQFEQVLAWDVDEREQMVFALRQADGARLQFVLVVRDEFWTAMSRLMRDLDSALRDHRNAMGLERFSATHAKHVLRTWAESAPPGSEIDDDFVDSAIKLVEEKNRVIPVRLALLVSVLGEEPWTAARLADVAKRGSLSACYLDSILGAESSAEGRRLSEPARRVLRALTPVTGLIRGPARSTEELHDISGLDNAEFEDLLDLLNRRSHLMTPVDRADEATTRATSIDYNLAHDFLVPELRSWLEELERTTARGRAALDLRAAAQRWSVEASSTQLAGPIDCLRFGFLASPTDERERRFLRASARRGLSRSMVVAVVAIAAAVLFQYALLRNSGNALVKRLGDCDVNQLSDVIDETRDNWLFTERPLRDAIRGAVESGNFPKQDRFSLALLATEPEQANYLSDRLLRCEPELLRQILAQMRSDLDGDDLEATVDRFASVASEESYITGQRLRAAIAVAALDPEHAFWRQSANSICELLVASDPTEIGWMADGLWPIRTSLIPELKRVVSDNGSEQLRTATFLLAKFATDDDVAMVEILENAGLSQLSAVAPAIRAASDSVNSRLNERLEELLDAYLNVALDMELQSLAPTRAQPDGGENLLAKRRVLLARRIANVAALMLQRGCGETCLELLRSSSDPTLRSYVIHCYAVSEGPAEPLADVLVGKTESAQEATIESGIAAALLQTLGSLPASSQVPLAVRDLARRWSRISDNMELRSSATFFLCHQGYADSVGEVSLDENSVAYRTVAGQAMVRLPAALNATVGASPWDASQLANEQTHRISVPDHLYVSRHEVTVEQFNQFLQSRGRPLMDARSGSGSTTAIRIGFYQAAAFCNWLSEQEDIPEADWCFVPNASGHYAAGMSIAKDHLSRQGYQLPTADLWEYACRAGSSTPRHYGYGIELSTPYVRWMGSRSGASRNPMSVRKPNGFGLFDMLGNASEWSLTVVSDTSANYPSMNSERASQDPGRFLQRASRPGLAFGGGPEHEDASGKTITDRTRFLMLGGSFDSPAHKVRSSDRSMVSPPITNQPIGIRLMRIVREEVR
ncbi:MAG: SUMF1/EgtB/PvdO family nonheme iron enzyme [Planctomycetota bacterium]